MVLSIASNKYILENRGAKTLTIVEHKKCKRCKKVQHVSLLKENEAGEGVVCLDLNLCEIRQIENHNLMEINLHNEEIKTGK